MKYAEHKAKWSGCTLCPLSRERTRVVLARGKIPSPILFIGEAPGDSEDVIGKPFVGPAGQLLDLIIDQAIDGQYDYAMTNLVACIPKIRNEDGELEKGEPEKEHIESCSERLGEFVNMANPRVIVLVGALASKWIKGQAQFGGRYDWEYESGVEKPIITFVQIAHPAFILRMNIAARPLEIKRAVATIAEAIEDLD